VARNADKFQSGVKALEAKGIKAADQGNANLESAKVADKFWEIYRARREPSVSVS
jgi:hypothetical protein